MRRTWSARLWTIADVQGLNNGGWHAKRASNGRQDLKPCVEYNESRFDRLTLEPRRTFEETMGRANSLRAVWLFNTCRRVPGRHAWGGFCTVLMYASVAIVLSSSPRVAPSDGVSALDGYWQSDGYGLLVEVAKNEMVVSEITDVSRIQQA